MDQETENATATAELEALTTPVQEHKALTCTFPGPLPVTTSLISWPKDIDWAERDVPVLVQFEGLAGYYGAQLRPVARGTALLIVPTELRLLTADIALVDAGAPTTAADVVSVSPYNQPPSDAAITASLMLSHAGQAIAGILTAADWPQEMREDLKIPGMHWDLQGLKPKLGTVVSTIEISGCNHGFTGAFLEVGVTLFEDGRAFIAAAVLRSNHEFEAKFTDGGPVHGDTYQRSTMVGQVFPEPLPSKHLPCKFGPLGVPRKLLGPQSWIPEWAEQSLDGNLSGGAGICPLGTWDGRPATLGSVTHWLWLKGSRAIFHRGRALSHVGPPKGAHVLEDAYGFSDVDQGPRVFGWKTSLTDEELQPFPWAKAKKQKLLNDWLTKVEIKHCPPGLQWLIRTTGGLAHLAESGHAPARVELEALFDTLYFAGAFKTEPLGRGAGWLLLLIAQMNRLSLGFSDKGHLGFVAADFFGRLQGEGFLHTQLGHKDLALFPGSNPMTDSVGSAWESAIVAVGIAACHQSGVFGVPPRAMAKALWRCLDDITSAWSMEPQPGGTDLFPVEIQAIPHTWAYKLHFRGGQLLGRYFGGSKFEPKVNTDAELYMPAALATSLAVLRRIDKEWASNPLFQKASSQLLSFLGRFPGETLLDQAQAYFNASKGKAQHGWAAVTLTAVHEFFAGPNDSAS